MTVPGSPTLVTVSGSTLVEPGEIGPKLSAALLTPPSTNRPTAEPDSATVGLPPLVATVNVSVCAAIDTGENSTTRVQLFPAVTPAAQVLSAIFTLGPLIDGVTVNVPPPMLATNSGKVVVVPKSIAPNDSLLVESCATGAPVVAAIPKPESSTVAMPCPLPSGRLTEPWRNPAASGAKVTLTVQVVPA